MIKNILIETKNNQKHVMSVETYCRWLCLMEAMQVINQKAEHLNVDLTKSDKWIQPLEFQKYIKSRFPSLYHDFKVEENIV